MFSEKTFDFLCENRFRNSREWFHENKQDFLKYVYEPLASLAMELAPVISEIDPQIITVPKTDKTISRVYRDTRYSRDKLLYRDHMWLSFKRDKKAFPHYPEFFVVVTPDGFSYGCGYYEATPDAVVSMRKLITDRSPVFLNALNAFQAQNEFYLEGQRYKKSKYPNEPENIRNWLDRKNLCDIEDSKDFELLFSDKLGEKLGEAFMKMEALYNFFICAEESK